MSNLNPGDHAIIPYHETVYLVGSVLDEFVSVSWQAPGGRGRYHASLPHGVLIPVPKTYKPGTVIQDGEGDLWIALAENRFAYLTVDGKVDVEEAGVDSTFLEDPQAIEDQYGAIKVIHEFK